MLAPTDRKPKAETTTAAALNASEGLLSQALGFSCLCRMQMPAPEKGTTMETIAKPEANPKPKPQKS